MQSMSVKGCSPEYRTKGQIDGDTWHATINIPESRPNPNWIQLDCSKVQMASEQRRSWGSITEVDIKNRSRIFVSKISSTDIIKLELSVSSDLQIPSR